MMTICDLGVELLLVPSEASHVPETNNRIPIIKCISYMVVV